MSKVRLTHRRTCQGFYSYRGLLCVFSSHTHILSVWLSLSLFLTVFHSIYLSLSYSLYLSHSISLCLFLLLFLYICSSHFRSLSLFLLFVFLLFISAPFLSLSLSPPHHSLQLYFNPHTPSNIPICLSSHLIRALSSTTRLWNSPNQTTTPHSHYLVLSNLPRGQWPVFITLLT